MRDEASAIAYLERLFSARAIRGAGDTGDGEIGIGDDAAVLSTGGKVLWTIDEQAENTHFRREWLSWRDVGYRSFVAAASDIAAMGGTATHALSALALPSDFRDDDFLSIAEGQLEASRKTGIRVVGGNIARASEAHVTTTVIGNASRPILRSGAIAGDGVYVAGALGLAAAGLRALEAGKRTAETASAIAAWRRPPILFDAARTMSAHASAATDVSDGLARDLSHVAEASKVGVELDRAALVAYGARFGLDAAAKSLGADPLDFVLHGGEDYALVVTSRREIEGFSRIGSVVVGSGVRLDGKEVVPRGFDHF